MCIPEQQKLSASWHSVPIVSRIVPSRAYCCNVGQQSPTFTALPGVGVYVWVAGAQHHLYEWWVRVPSTYVNGASGASGGCLRSHMKLHLREWQPLVLSREAPLTQVEGAWAEGTCAHMRSFICMNGASCACARMCPLLVWVELHVQALAYLSHSPVSNRLSPRDWGLGTRDVEHIVIM